MSQEYDYNDVLILPKRSELCSRKNVNLEVTYNFNHSGQTWTGIPIIAANMDTIGTYEVYKVLSQYKMLTALHKFYNANDLKNMELNSEYFMISTGIGNNDYNRLVDILNTIEVKFICIDVANGYMTSLEDFIKKVRDNYPNKILVAGNIVDQNRAIELYNLGIDIVKVGIGGGSCCLTRAKTGIGRPQLGAIMDCAKAEGVYIIGDGGITCPGDVVKGFGGGAHFIMIGGQFGGHDENPGKLIEENGNQYKISYGMSSNKAMVKHYGSMEKYRTSEGRIVKIKYKGSIENTIFDYLGGLRSACTYLNVSVLDQLKNNCKFIKVQQQLNTIYA